MNAIVADDAFPDDSVFQIARRAVRIASSYSALSAAAAVQTKLWTTTNSRTNRERERFIKYLLLFGRWTQPFALTPRSKLYYSFRSRVGWFLPAQWVEVCFLCLLPGFGGGATLFQPCIR